MMNELMNLINACGDDVTVWELRDRLDITVEDFDGFADGGVEIDRDYDNPAAVDALLAWLDANCDSRTGDYYTDYRFGGAVVRVGYASFDI